MCYLSHHYNFHWLRHWHFQVQLSGGRKGKILINTMSSTHRGGYCENWSLNSSAWALEVMRLAWALELMHKLELSTMRAAQVDQRIYKHGWAIAMKVLITYILLLDWWAIELSVYFPLSTMLCTECLCLRHAATISALRNHLSAALSSERCATIWAKLSYLSWAHISAELMSALSSY